MQQIHSISPWRVVDCPSALDARVIGANRHGTDHVGGRRRGEHIEVHLVTEQRKIAATRYGDVVANIKRDTC